MTKVAVDRGLPWPGFRSYLEVENRIKQNCPDVKIVRSKADVTIIPDGEDDCSEDAPYAPFRQHLSDFLEECGGKSMSQQRKRGSGGNSGEATASQMRAGATTMANDESKTCKITGEQTCRCDQEGGMVPDGSFITLQGLLRKLFTDHAVYTMFYLKSAIFGGPDAPQLLARLLANQTDIGMNLGKIKSVGMALGKEIGERLTQHIKDAGAAVAAAINNAKDKKHKASTKAALTAAIETLFAEGDELSASISKMNPEMLPEDKVAEAFHHHNQQVLDLAMLLIEGRFNDEVAAYDMYYNHMLQISDMIFAAIR